MKNNWEEYVFNARIPEKNPKLEAMTHMQRTCKVKKKESINQSNKKTLT